VAVVLRSPGRAWALLVDRVRAQQEIAVRPLDRLLAGHPFASGWAISGSGSVVFVLQVARLAEWSGAAVPRPAPRIEREVAAETEKARAVLVVDDSISVRKLAARFLESAGLEVVTAVDGMDALEKLSQESFRVVVTDLEMPRMHGYELIGEIRRHPRWQRVPIVVCTSRSGEKHRRRARDMGAEGYVTKPFTKEELVEEVERVSLPEARAAAHEPARFEAEEMFRSR
jgi:chemosensory pili system protein ChpA (sensor histidine kinase/response regulator)